MNKPELAEQLARHEDIKLKPYRDTVGKLTIGIGRNLEDKGISEQEAVTMLDNDIEESAAEVRRNIPCFNELDSVRQNVLVNMAFNMGVSGLLKFKKTLKFIESGDYDKAATEMLDSVWAYQVGYRAIELSKQMATGEYQ